MGAMSNAVRRDASPAECIRISETRHKMAEIGQTVVLHVEKPAVGGRMIARAGGQVVLVTGAIPGERVSARVDRVGKGVLYASTVAVDDPSPDRIAALDPGCGGCLYAHITYERQLGIKSQVVADAFARIARLPLEAPIVVVPSPVAGYRMRARLHRVGGRFGYFREGTHDLCDVRSTRQLLPATCDVVDRLAGGLTELGNTTVDGLELMENVDASERAVHLDVTRPHGPVLRSEHFNRDGVTGLTVGMLSGGSRTLHGRPLVTDRIELGNGDSFVVRRHVLAFFQGNRFLLRDLVTHVTGQVSRESRVADLYAGGGLFAVAAARSAGARVIAVEGDRLSAEDLHANASTSGNALVTSVHQAVESFVKGAPADIDVVIADPPRTGMSRDALDGGLQLAPKRIIYVSCDVATLARDARRIVDGGYRLDRLDAFDLFPLTPHVECVAVFDRWQRRSDQEPRRFDAERRGDQMSLARTKASKMDRNSPVRQKFSGCHCTPMQNGTPGSSIASTTPSGAVAETRKPGATCLSA
jgi:23S rRNA (uracil1939-C5)-methyltransferase